LRQNRFACVAFALAFVGLALVVLPEAVFEPPKPAGGAVRSLWHWWRATPDPATLAFEAKMRHFRVAGLSAGIAAAVLAIIGVLRRERRAVALTALGVAGLVLVWQYLALGIVVVFVLLLLFNLAV
jgi:drug/metabolite transporter (DMT)-like permease